MADTKVAETKKKKVKKGQSELGRTWVQLKKNKLAMVGLFIFIAELILAFAAPLYIPYEITYMDSSMVRVGPCAEHWFGTDNLGRDIFSRICYGGRYSLTMGVLTVAISNAIGIVIGCIAGYFGGWVDNIIMRIMDVFQSMPGMLLNIVLCAVLGSGYFNTILALSIGSIPGSVRMMRASMLKERDSEYVEACTSINCSTPRIIFSHLLPNSFSPMLVGMSMGMATTITMAASLSFIGLGIQPPTPDWGAMLSDARSYIRTSPHMIIFPGLAIAITVLALNFLGDGVRDATDPKLKR